MDPVSFSIGAASFAFQVFDGVKIGFGYFEDAAHMPRDCASLRLRLLFEYARFLDWADVAGLSDPRYHDEYDVKLHSNKSIIYAALNELRATLEQVTVLKSSYKQFDAADRAVDEANGDASAAGAANHLSVADPREIPGGSINRSVVTADGLRQKSAIEKIDLDKYNAIFQSVDLPVKRKHSRVVDHLIRGKRALTDVATHPRTLWWAAREKAIFTEKLGRIKGIVDFLAGQLGESKMQTLLDNSRETCLSMIELTNDVKEMKELLDAVGIFRTPQQAQALNSAASSTTTLVGSPIREGAMNLNELYMAKRSSVTFEQLTRFRIQHQEAYTNGEEGEKAIKTSLSDVGSKVTDEHYRTFYTKGEVSFWIEWKPYKEVRLTGLPLPTFGAAQDVVGHVKALTALLQDVNKPAEFRIPKCVGYCQDEEETQFGFVYELPHNVHQPRTLFSLFERGPASIEARVRTAQDLTLSLLFLHAVGWLHKDIHSHNILFLADEPLPELDGFRLSGFEYARPDKHDLTNTGRKGSVEEEIYAHPRYQGNGRHFGFRKTFDIYSIGIVLLELAYWRPVKSILAEKKNPTSIPDSSTAPSTMQSLSEKHTGIENPETQAATASEMSAEELRGVREQILNVPAILEGVRLNMGDKFTSAIRACILGADAFGIPPDVPETDPIVSTLLQLAYLRLVVEVLQGIVV